MKVVIITPFYYIKGREKLFHDTSCVHYLLKYWPKNTEVYVFNEYHSWFKQWSRYFYKSERNYLKNGYYFQEDGIKVNLIEIPIFPKQKKARILERRTLPSGDFVWNQLDDDTLNLRQKDGVWTVSRRGALLYNQPNVDGDASPGAWLTEQYEGVLPAADCPGIRYQLTLKHRAHSGDGYFLLLTTYLEAENGRDATFAYIGRRLTQRGSAQNPDVTVWQLISDTDQSVWNFKVQSHGQTLQLLTQQFEEIPSNLSYELEKLK